MKGARCWRGCYFRKGKEGKLSLSRALSALLWPGLYKNIPGRRKSTGTTLRQECVCPSKGEGPNAGRVVGGGATLCKASWA